MKKIGLDLLARLTSRTLWVFIATFSAFMAAGAYTEALGVALAYIAGEKALDVSKTLKQVKTYIPDVAAGKEALDNADFNDGSAGVTTGARAVPRFDEAVDEE